jgi:hypothetical protein
MLCPTHGTDPSVVWGENPVRLPTDPQSIVLYTPSHTGRHSERAVQARVYRRIEVQEVCHIAQLGNLPKNIQIKEGNRL